MRRTSALNWILALPLAIWALTIITRPTWIDFSLAVPGAIFGILAWRRVFFGFVGAVVMCALNALVDAYVLFTATAVFWPVNWLHPLFFVAVAAALFSSRREFARPTPSHPPATPSDTA